MDHESVLFSYAAYSKKEDIRSDSSSGGIFSLLAERILALHGVVYGVIMSDDNKSAEFLRADTIYKLERIRGSKYLQAKVGDTFKEVKKDLDEGLPVLFTGVGCQMNGLKAFLEKEYDNLYCVDVICHGVPSPVLWKKYVENLEALNRAELVSVKFRCKDDSWSNFGMKRIDSKNREYYISKDKDSFMQMFLRNLCLRPSCYECFAKQEKKSDITIGDLWGAENIVPEMNDNKGISFVIIRSEKGEQFFNSIRSETISKLISYEDGVKENICEYKSVKRPKQRDTFLRDMNVMNFGALENKYLSGSFRERLKRIWRRIRSYRMEKRI